MGEKLNKKKLMKQWVTADSLHFARHFFRATHGDSQFVLGRHHRLICDKLNAVLRGECKRLIINIAPRYSKSELVVKNFIAMGLAINPRAKFIHLSYSDSLVQSNSEEVKDIVKSEEYQRLFDTRIKEGSDTKKQWNTTAGGGMYATSTLGQITGFGAGLVDSPDNPHTFGGAIIIDDPIKPEDALSDVEREKVNRRFETTIRNRVNSRNTPIIIIMQRLHENDLCGYLQRIEPGVWDTLSIPCLSLNADGEEESLWPFKHTVEELHAIKAANSYVFETQYMQDPKPIEGLMYSRFKTYSILPKEKFIRRNYTDTADTGADYLCSICYLETKTAMYVTDILLTKRPMEYTETKTAEMLLLNRTEDASIESNNGGRGFSRSSSRNAQRLARTEINMAYRVAEQERWKQFDFVVGYEVKLTQNGRHVYDVCDCLKGRYPKTFKFAGWHPHCLCYSIPILKTEDEFFNDDEDAKSVNEVEDVPDNFKDWVKDNSDRIEAAQGRGTLPYFIRDNYSGVDEIMHPELKERRLREEAEARAKEEAKPKEADAPKVKTADDAIAEALGITRGEPMTHEEANELRANPHYVEEFILDAHGKYMDKKTKNRMSKNPEYARAYHVNCQSCVVAYEMRRRGIDVEAFGNTRKKNTTPFALSVNSNMAWRDKNGRAVMPTKLINEVYTGKPSEYRTYLQSNFDALTKNVGRYHINWEWSNGKTGHIICSERKPDGSLFFYDPQNGKILDNILLNNQIATHTIKVLRVDNLRPNLDVVRGVVKPAGSTAATPLMDEAQKAWWKKHGGDNIGNYVQGSDLNKSNTLSDQQKARRTEIKTIMVSKDSNNYSCPLFDSSITLPNKSVKEWLNQPHYAVDEKNELLLQLQSTLDHCTEKILIPIKPKYQESVSNVYALPIKIKERESWIIVHEMKWGEVKIHGISDSAGIFEK